MTVIVDRPWLPGGLPFEARSRLTPVGRLLIEFPPNGFLRRLSRTSSSQGCVRRKQSSTVGQGHGKVMK